MSDLPSILGEVRADLGDYFLSSDIVGLDGISIAGEAAAEPGFNTDLAAAHIAMIMKLAERVSGKLKLGKVTENQLTTDDLIALSRPLGDGSFYWSVVAKGEATYGLMRAVMDQYDLRLWGAISA